MPQDNKQFSLTKKHVFISRKQTPDEKQREMKGRDRDLTSL